MRATVVLLLLVSFLLCQCNGFAKPKSRDYDNCIEQPVTDETKPAGAIDRTRVKRHYSKAPGLTGSITTTQASGTTKLHDIEALCQPHLTVISLDHSRPGLLRPLYIKLHRFAGSCTSPHLHCTLKTQEEVKIPVTDLLGKQAVVRTMNHTSCDCACAIVPDQCLQSEQWSEAHCRCLATRRNLVSMIRGIGYNIMK